MELLSEPIETEMPQDPLVLPHPLAFTFRGERFAVARLLEMWTDAGFADKRRGKHQWWERRHRNYVRVETTDGTRWDLYLERGARRRWFAARRWHEGEEM